MNSHIRLTIAATLAAGSFAVAHAEVSLVDEPVATATANDDATRQLVQMLNQDAALKGSKITVQPENSGDTHVLWITGVTKTEEQMKHVSDLAASQAGEMKVANVIQPEHITMKTPSQYVGADQTAQVDVQG